MKTGTSLRVLGVLTCASGLLVLTRPRTILRWACGESRAPRPGVVRLLGGRLALQGAALAAVPRRDMARFCAAVDGLHAASMLAVCRIAPAYRRSALTSAAVATASAVATVAAARS